MPEFDIRRYTDLADLNPESITVGPIDDGREDAYAKVGPVAFDALAADYAATLCIVGQELAKEAIRRGWCAEFEEFLEHLASKLPQPLHTHADYEVEVNFNISMRTTVSNVRFGSEGEELEAAYFRQNNNHPSALAEQLVDRYFRGHRFQRVDVSVS